MPNAASRSNRSINPQHIFINVSEGCPRRASYPFSFPSCLSEIAHTRTLAQTHTRARARSKTERGERDRGGKGEKGSRHPGRRSTLARHRAVAAATTTISFSLDATLTVGRFPLPFISFFFFLPASSSRFDDAPQTHSAKILWRRVHARPRARAHAHALNACRGDIDTRRRWITRRDPPLTSAGSPVAAGPRPRLPLHGVESAGEYPFLPPSPFCHCSVVVSLSITRRETERTDRRRDGRER